MEGLRHVIGMCLDLGYGETDIRKMIGGNAAQAHGPGRLRGAPLPRAMNDNPVRALIASSPMHIRQYHPGGAVLSHQHGRRL